MAEEKVTEMAAESLRDPPLSNEKVVVFISSLGSRETAFNKADPKTDWYFLGKGYAEFSATQSRYPNLKIHDMSDKFHDLAEKHWRDFLAFSSALNLANNNSYYWSSIIASRNVLTIPIYRYFLYVLVATELVTSRRGNRPIGFIVEDVVLGDQLARILKGKGASVKFSGRTEMMMSQLKLAIKIVARGIFYWIRVLCRGIYSAMFAKPPSINGAENLYILRPWASLSNFDENGNFADRNFGDLRGYLRNQSKSVVNYPLFIGRTFLEDLRAQVNSNETFLIQEQFLWARDYLATFIDSIKLAFINVPQQTFCGLDVRRLVLWCHLRTVLSPMEMGYNLSIRLLKRLSQLGVGVDKVIYPMENNSQEKLLIRGLRTYFPETQILGYQHTVWYQRQYGMRLLPEELGHHPLPDIIVSSASVYADILKETGFPSSIVRSGPNLRFKLNVPVRSIPKNGRVLVVLSYDDDEAAGLVVRSCEALVSLAGDVSDVWIKPHPQNDMGKLRDLVAQYGGAMNPSLVSGALQDLAKQCQVVVCGPTSVVNLEVSSVGVPIIRLSSMGQFNIEPIWESGDYWSLVANHGDLVSRLKHYLRIDDLEEKRILDLAQSIRDKYFGKCDDAGLAVFTA